MKSELKTILELLEMRQKTIIEDCKLAVSCREWSKVPKLDGMEIGISIAIRIIKDRINFNRKYE